MRFIYLYILYFVFALELLRSAKGVYSYAYMMSRQCTVRLKILFLWLYDAVPFQYIFQLY
jgi:hypothetical protein